MKFKTKPDVLISGKRSFKLEVPYKLIETGRKDQQKPFIIYLHGYGQNMKTFRKECEGFMEMAAYHLFIEGPYPIYERNSGKKVSEWGKAWYLYDGNRGQFIKSLEVTSEFIQEIVEHLVPFTNASRVSVIGYSMGGYQAGYFGLTRWKHVSDLVVIGARIKTEVLNENWENIRHLNVLALHGKDDEKVKYEPQQKEIEKLKSHGIYAEFVLTEGDHSFRQALIPRVIRWMKTLS